jgi:hypothetical protein
VTERGRGRGRRGLDRQPQDLAELVGDVGVALGPEHVAADPQPHHRRQGRGLELGQDHEDLPLVAGPAQRGQAPAAVDGLVDVEERQVELAGRQGGAQVLLRADLLDGQPETASHRGQAGAQRRIVVGDEHGALRGHVRHGFTSGIARGEHVTPPRSWRRP